MIKEEELHTPGKHAAFAQVYLWLQVYETEQTQKRLGNVFPVLHDDFMLHNVDGTWKGKERYMVRLGLMKTWQNAQHTRAITFIPAKGNEQMQVKIDCIYQNILPDHTSESYDVTHHIRFICPEGKLPIITEIRVEPTRKHEVGQFKSAYAYNRAMSFLYYWLHCMETQTRNEELFSELLSPDLIIQADTGEAFNTWRQFSAWFCCLFPAVTDVSCEAKRMHPVKTGNDTIILTGNITLTGISADQKNIALDTHIEWLLVNDPDERYTRIKMMKINMLSPVKKGAKTDTV